MKINKIYVENFGTLCKFEHQFKEGLNEILENNGWGKTTLAVFIKSMFYGLNKTKTSKLNENERKKYMPWQGGNFGGYIEVGIGGKEYRIERFFGKKESEDTFKLIDLRTGKSSNAYGENIGEQIFGLNSEGYEKSTFIPQKDLPSGINESISSKLVNMIQGTDNKDSYENAIAIIEERRAQLQKRGGSGEINNVELQLEKINEKINALKKSGEDIKIFEEKISQKDEEIENLEKDKLDIDKQIAKYGEVQEILAEKKIIEGLKEKQIQLENNLQSYKKTLNGKSLSEEELNFYSQKEKELIESEARLKTLNENDFTATRREQLLDFFKGNPPTEEETSEYIQKAEKLKLLQGEQKPAQKSKKWIFLTILLFAAVFCAAGGIIFSKQNIVAIVLFALGGISLLASLFLYFKNYIDKRTQSLSDYDEEHFNKLKNEIENFLSKFDYHGEEYSKFLIDMRNKLNELNSLQTSVIENQKVKTDVVCEIKNLKNQLDNFFAQFDFEKDCSYQEKLNILLITLKNIDQTQLELSETLRKLELKEDKDVALEEIDIEQIQKRQKDCQAKIDLLKSERKGYAIKCDELKDALCEIDDLENNKEELTNKRDSLKNEFKIIGLTKKFLTEANDNLSAKYLKPMQEGLNKYFKILLGGEYKKLDIDTDLNVYLENGGAQREIDYLSKGYQGTIDLCIRFALLDTLFKGEKPFLIFDDPFVNMDKDKLENAKTLLREISKDYQLVYFVCHDSRKCM